MLLKIRTRMSGGIFEGKDLNKVFVLRFWIYSRKGYRLFLPMNLGREITVPFVVRTKGSS